MADETTGTPATPTVDGAASATGTTVATQAGGAGLEETPEALKARITELESIHKQDLARLTAGEEARRRLEELEQRTSQPTSPPAGYDPSAQTAQHYALLWQKAQEGDVEAITQLVAAGYQASKAEIDQTKAEIRWFRELDQVPLQDRDAVRQRAQKDRIAPSVAHAFVKAERLDAKEKELEAQSRKLEEERARLSRSVVSTTATPAPAAAPTSDFTAAEYAQTALAAGRGDFSAKRKLQEMDAAREAGKQFKPG